MKNIYKKCLSAGPAGNAIAASTILRFARELAALWTCRLLQVAFSGFDPVVISWFS